MNIDAPDPLRLADPKGFMWPNPKLAIRRPHGLPLAGMEPARVKPRLVEARLEEALGDGPVVLIQGPRQSGKTTLAQRVGGKRGYAYFNLDDDVVRAAAEADPVGFVADLPSRTILDEVQRVPSLFTA